MAQIALNKPSGGQLLIQPEDGTSTETVTIPSVGVGKVLGYAKAYANQGVNNNITVSANVPYVLVAKTYTKKDPTSTIFVSVEYSMYTDSGSPYTRESILFDHSGSTYSEGVLSGFNTNLNQDIASAPEVEEVSQVGQIAHYVHSFGGNGVYVYGSPAGSFTYNAPSVSIAMAVCPASTSVTFRNDVYGKVIMHIWEVAA